MIMITMLLTTKSIKNTFTCSFAYKVVCIDDKIGKPVVLYRGKNAFNKFLEAIFKENEYYKKMIKNHFNNKSCHVCRR